MGRMTYSEYEKKFSEAFRRMSKEQNEQATEDFLNTIIKGNHAKKQYLDDCNMSDLMSKDLVRPEVFASWAVELYPEDFEVPAKIDEKSNIFLEKMHFRGVR